MHGPALLVRIQSFKSEFVYVANTYYVCTTLFPEISVDRK